MKKRNATRHPGWMRLAVKLAIWVALALVTPLFLGIVYDSITGQSPKGLLLGLMAGTLMALIVVLRTIQHRLLALAPPTETENAKESS